MLNTEEEVSPRDIDKQGRYDPKAKNGRSQFEHRLFHRVSGMEGSARWVPPQKRD
jgi:hypothetical protein